MKSKYLGEESTSTKKLGAGTKGLRGNLTNTKKGHSTNNSKENKICMSKFKFNKILQFSNKMNTN